MSGRNLTSQITLYIPTPFDPSTLELVATAHDVVPTRAPAPVHELNASAERARISSCATVKHETTACSAASAFRFATASTIGRLYVAHSTSGIARCATLMTKRISSEISVQSLSSLRLPDAFIK